MIWAIFTIGLGLRLALAAIVPPAHDIAVWEHFAWLPSPYEPTTGYFYAYAPVWFWIFKVVAFLARQIGWDFAFAVRLPIILADVALFWLILRRARQTPGGLPVSLAVCGAFFLNPVSVQISGFYGQFDNISLLFAWLAWEAWASGRSHRFARCLAWLNLSVAVKHFTLMLIPLFTWVQPTRRKRLVVLLASPLLFVAALLPYWPTGAPQIMDRVLGYNLHAGYWGWSGVICRSLLFFTSIDLIQQPWFHYLDYFNVLLYLGILAAARWISQRYDLLDAILVVFLIFYAFTTQIAPQYTIWIIPFASLRPHRYFYAYSLVGGVQLAAFYYAHYHWFHRLPFVGPIPNLIPETFILFRYLTWLVCVLWLFHMIKKQGPAWAGDGPLAARPRDAVNVVRRDRVPPRTRHGEFIG